MVDYEEEIFYRREASSPKKVFSNDEFDHEMFYDHALVELSEVIVRSDLSATNSEHSVVDNFARVASHDDHELVEVIDSMIRTDLSATNVANTVVALDPEIWMNLPDQLLSKILTLLPPAAILRFRCVCSQWKSLFSSSGWLQLYSEVKHRPSCTVWCTHFSREADFFCHTEQKWFKIPRSYNSYCEREWDLVDSDVGLLLYQCDTGDGLLFLVCNPLTKFSQVLPLYWDLSNGERTYIDFLKLLVDRQTHHFKVVVLVPSRGIKKPKTIVYDSKTAVWSVCKSYPSPQYLERGSFVWKNAIYLRTDKTDLLLAFDIDSGIWSEVRIHLPCHHRWHPYIVNNNGRLLLFQPDLLLFQLDLKVEEPIAAWELLDDALNCPLAASKCKWMKLTLSLPTSLGHMLTDVVSCFSQTDCIGFSIPKSNNWITYTFGTKSWCVMPSPRRQHWNCSWLEWEPRLDI